MYGLAGYITPNGATGKGMVLHRDGGGYMGRAALGDRLGAPAAARAMVDAVTRNAGVTLHGRYAAVTGTSGQTDVSFCIFHASIYIGG